MEIAKKQRGYIKAYKHSVKKVWNRTDIESVDTYAIAFVTHSQQPEGQRRHVTLSCIQRQEQFTSQHGIARNTNPYEKIY
jgi:hypothetical protein